MKVSYFGGVDSGKSQVQHEFIHNTKRICSFSNNKTIDLSTVEVKDNTIIWKKLIVGSNNSHVKVHKIDLTNKENFIRVSIKNWRDNYSLSKKDLEKIKQKNKEKENFKESFDYTDLSLCDYKKCCEEIISSDLFIPNYNWYLIDTLDYRHIPEDISERFNVIPYKENLEDSFICKLNIIKDIEKYSKMQIFSKLNQIVISSRKLELLLKDADINYEYFNLDVDSYEKLGIKEKLDRKWSHYSSWAGLNRYEYLKDLAQEYLFEYKIKDVRLCGVKFDGLNPL